MKSKRFLIDALFIVGTGVTLACVNEFVSETVELKYLFIIILAVYYLGKFSAKWRE